MKTIKSNDSKNILTAITLTIVGVILISLTLGKGYQSSNRQAAMWLGYLLIFIAATAFVFYENIEVVFNHKKKSFLYKYKNRFKESRRIVPYKEVEIVNIVTIGTARAKKIHFLKIRLKSGVILSTGIWSMSRDDIQKKADEISREIECEQVADEYEKDTAYLIDNSLPKSHLILALVISFVSYVLFYRIKIGPLCVAMWLGNLPALWLTFGTWAIFLILVKRKVR